MTDLLVHLVDAPLANILIVAGLAFLAIGIVGKISGKIEPSISGRIMSGLLGVLLVVYGIYAHARLDAAQGQAQRGGSSDSGAQTRPGQHPGEPRSDGQLSGAWRNDNPQTRGITRLEVQQNGDAVAVHAWGACSPAECDWGTAKGLASGGSASVTWDQGFVLRNMVLAPDGARLRMALDSVYRDNRSPQNSVEYFVRFQ